jgi:hypothetical protein
VRAVQVAVYSAVGIPALGILASGIGYVVCRAQERVDLSMTFGRLLVGSLYAGVVGASLALVAGVVLARRGPPA